LLNYVFEDLRRTKTPNNTTRKMRRILGSCLGLVCMDESTLISGAKPKYVASSSDGNEGDPFHKGETTTLQHNTKQNERGIFCMILRSLRRKRILRMNT
jgi:hypothetical protein